MLTGLPPLLSGRTRLLILGSFPSVASLAEQQYYGHPQNHFWRILQAIWPLSPYGTDIVSYQVRSDWLLSKGLGVWDVYASCERAGSLDSAIRNPIVNDFAALLRRCPALEAIAYNGAKSFKQARHVRAALAGSAAHEVASVGVQFHQLPSTSPANASWSFERKLAAWREVFEKHGLI